MSINYCLVIKSVFSVSASLQAFSNGSRFALIIVAISRSNDSSYSQAKAFQSSISIYNFPAISFAGTDSLAISISLVNKSLFSGSIRYLANKLASDWILKLKGGQLKINVSIATFMFYSLSNLSPNKVLAIWVLGIRCSYIRQLR